jgi:phycocyanobilin:ferredoxin oxidoreductase
MSEIWDRMIECEQQIIKKCATLGEETFDDPEFDWLNRVFKGDHFRRAHIDSVDARDTKGLYMTHICVFPNFNNTAPIYGFDIICGKNKVTGAFHDYSPSWPMSHPMIDLFAESTKNLEWKKERALPPWAEAIFTPHMVAVSNVKTIQEMDQVVTMALDNLDMYFTHLPKYTNIKNDADQIKRRQNRYCHYQKQNPHTPKVMESLGLDASDVKHFIEDCLFPEV